jgi:hypothetical protein
MRWTAVHRAFIHVEVDHYVRDVSSGISAANFQQSGIFVALIGMPLDSERPLIGPENAERFDAPSGDLNKNLDTIATQTGDSADLRNVARQVFHMAQELKGLPRRSLHRDHALNVVQKSALDS